MRTRTHVLNVLLVLVAGLMASQAQAAGYYAHVDSVTPTQYNGQCPTTVQLKARVSAPAGKPSTVRIQIDQKIPGNAALPSGYGANLTFPYTGAGETVVTNIDRSFEVYGAKTIWIEVTEQVGTWNMSAVDGAVSNQVSLSFVCAGAMASQIKTKKQVSSQVTHQPPARPEHLTATADKRVGIDHVTTVRLNWQTPASLVPPEGFKIERKIQGQSGGFVIIAQMQKPQNAPLPTSYNDTGLDYGKTYIYRMKTFNAYGESPYSNQATVQPAAGNVAGYMASQKPAQPAGLRAQAAAPDNVLLQWQVAPGNPVATSAIKGFAFSILKPGEMTWLPAGTMPVTNGQTTGSFSFHYASTSLHAGQKYSFRVCSYRDEALTQVSDYSNVAQVIMPGNASTPPKIGGQPSATPPGPGTAKKLTIK